MNLRFFSKSLLFFLLLGFCACANKIVFKNSTSIHLSMKTEKLKFNDFGFLYTAKNQTRLELYQLGQALLDLNIQKDKICLKQACFSKQEFNQKYLASSYYDDFLEDILHFKALYNGKNLEKTSQGFKQNLPEYDIFYEINDHGLNFKDKKHHIILTIKKVDNE